MEERKSGSARQSVKVFVLRGFLETPILLLCSRQRQHSHQNGQNSEFPVEMTLGGTYRGILAEDCCPSHRAWKPAPNAGSHISTATTTAGCCQQQRPTPLESGALTNSCTEPEKQRCYGYHSRRACANTRRTTLQYIKPSHHDAEFA